MPNQDATNIQQVEVDNLDNLLGFPGADNIITSPDDTTKTNIFSKAPKVDLSFVNTPASKTPEAPVVKKEDSDDNITSPKNTQTSSPANQTLTDEALKDISDTLNNINDLQDNENGTGKNTGRPKLDKDGILELTKKFIEEGTLAPFDDEKPLEEYTLKDFEELFKANYEDRENKIRESTPVEFFQSLPPELQVAAKYHADGGKDMKSLFKVLAQVEETRSLNPEDPKDQESIVREYLRATNFGSEDEIQESIDEWKDMDKLSEKANKFKPKLDTMNSEMVSQKLAQQELLKKQQEEASRKYTDNVYNTIKSGELNGIKLDKKTQGFLFNGLVSPQYPSMSGRPTNLLGHLLEKYQVVEPNHSLVAEALWLLSNPDEYREKIRETGKKEQVIETVKKLKTEESLRKNNGSSAINEETTTRQRTIPRTSGFFARQK